MQRHFVFLVAVRTLIEEGVELEVLVDRDGIKLVRVALGAGHRGAHPHRKGGVHPVDDGGVAEFLVVGAAFVLRHRVAMKRGCDELIVRGIWQKVACVLLDSELIKRHVRIQRTHHPVAVGPDLTRLIARVAGTVCITCEIQPLPCPMLAIGGKGEVMIDDLVVGLRGQRIQFCERGW